MATYIIMPAKKPKIHLVLVWVEGQLRVIEVGEGGGWKSVAHIKIVVYIFKLIAVIKLKNWKKKNERMKEKGYQENEYIMINVS